MWFTFALIAGVFFAINGLMIRHYAKNNTDMWILSFYFSFLGSVIMLPFFLYEFQFPKTIAFLGIVLLTGVVLVINNYLGFKASKLVGASMQSILSKVKYLWLIITGIVIFGEILTTKKIIGMILILTASMLIIDYQKWTTSKKGIILILLATVTSTIYAVLVKKIVGTSGVLTTLFLVAFVPAILNAILIPDFLNRAKKALSNIKMLILIVIVGMIANLAMIKALSYDVLSGVYFIMDASLIIIVFGEHIFLSERERLGWKILAIIITIIGATFIR